MPPLVRGARGLLQSPFFQAVGGHWASHMKPRLADGVDAAAGEPPKVHGCSICGLAEFAIGQALGGHMCRRRPANAAGKGGLVCMQCVTRTQTNKPKPKWPNLNRPVGVCFSHMSVESIHSQTPPPPLPSSTSSSSGAGALATGNRLFVMCPVVCHVPFTAASTNQL